jgi:hypothetical protein
MAGLFVLERVGCDGLTEAVAVAMVADVSNGASSRPSCGVTRRRPAMALDR